MEKKMEKEEEFIDFEHLGKAVKFFRKSRKMTQKELAEKLNKTPYTIKRYEKDGKIPLEVAKEIIEILHIPKLLLAGFIIDIPGLSNEVLDVETRKELFFDNDKEKMEKENREDILEKLIVSFGYKIYMNADTLGEENNLYIKRNEEKYATSLDNFGCILEKLIDIIKYHFKLELSNYKVEELPPDDNEPVIPAESLKNFLFDKMSEALYRSTNKKEKDTD